MSGEEIIKEIENLDEDQRGKVLVHVYDKYFKGKFIVDGDNDPWCEEDDDLYRELPE